MIKPRILEDCYQCNFYGRSQDLVCTHYPVGYSGSDCPQFKLRDTLPNDEVLSSISLNQIDGKLVVDELQYLSRISDT